ncbi:MULTISPECIES: SUMF1/EgtB/PvdO family nonheme iron enzyme [unclassified Thiocapsa]|uniref:SUMF1/EgtB/PvdO family nonheme iron enzyme n=1 Tax=unclassified Thiocapsa TaxID=2641286 RepID=UPI0035B27C12
MTEQPLTRLEQLKRALDAGFLDQDTYDTAAATLSAQLQGSGAVAQGQDAIAIGAAGVGVQGNNDGVINTGVLIQQGTRPGASPADLRRAYLARILCQADQLPLFTGDGASAQVRLSAVYTALLTQRSAVDADPNERSALLGRSPEGSQRKASAVDVLNTDNRLVLLGGPGSGKSTFASIVALCMAGELLEVPGLGLATLTAPLARGDDADKESQPQRWNHEPLLPVFVVLRDLASQLPLPGTPVAAQTLWEFICGRLKQAALEDFAPHLQQHLLDKGGLVLLDGLDEVPDAGGRRVQIKQAVQDFVATFSKCRFLVTSRTYAYQRQDWKLDGFGEAHLLPFTTEQIGRFVHAWYGHMVELQRLGESDANDRAAVLIRAVEHSERLRELAERPLLLTLIAKLQTEAGGALPEKREELYDKAVEMLLTQWERMKIRVRDDGTKVIEPSLAEGLNAERDAIRRQLDRLAFEAHRDQPQLTGTADIRQETLIAALLNAGNRREEPPDVALLERYLRDRAGILVSHGVGMYQFPHRSFQEYLAACHLTNDEFPDKLAELARTDPGRWREVALLAGAKAARGSSLSAWALAETLCPKAPAVSTPAEDHWGGLLAGRILVECADLDKVAPRDEAKRARVRDWQLAILRDNRLPATERALAGRSLAVLGDPRPEVMTLDGMQFCLVPPGTFLMGEDDSGFADEQPRHRVDLPYPYFIGRFPITVAQWREYLRSGGGATADDVEPRGRDNDPVVELSWHDALLFCDHLTAAWRERLPEGFIVTLPSEAEWEKAARGGEQLVADNGPLSLDRLISQLQDRSTRSWTQNPYQARVYPWGDHFDGEMANVELAIGETSAVGCYRAGFSPYGCEELSGNVLEWTRSLWGKKFETPDFGHPYDPADATREVIDAGDEVLRVVRGGSWLAPQHLACCAFRFGIQPDNRIPDLGVRVVLRATRAF